MLGLSIWEDTDTQTPVPPKVFGYYITEASAIYTAEDGVTVYTDELGRDYMTEISGIYITENAASKYVTETRS